MARFFPRNVFLLGPGGRVDIAIIGAAARAEERILTQTQYWCDIIMRLLVVHNEGFGVTVGVDVGVLCGCKTPMGAHQ